MVLAGFCRDLADEISEKLEFDYEIREVRDGQFGVELENGSWSGMIGELRRGVMSDRTQSHSRHFDKGNGCATAISKFTKEIHCAHASKL